MVCTTSVNLTMQEIRQRMQQIGKGEKGECKHTETLKEARSMSFIADRIASFMDAGILGNSHPAIL